MVIAQGLDRRRKKHAFVVRMSGYDEHMAPCRTIRRTVKIHTRIPPLKHYYACKQGGAYACPARSTPACEAAHVERAQARQLQRNYFFYWAFCERVAARVAYGRAEVWTTGAGLALT